MINLIFNQGVIGGSLSGKSSLIQRYITGTNPKEDVMPGKHKKTVSIRGHSNLLLIRDETGPPDYFVRNGFFNISIFEIKIFKI